MDTVFGKVKFKRRPLAGLGTLEEGEPGFTTDTREVFIGSAIGNVPIGNPPVLSARLHAFDDLTITGQALVGFDEDGDLFPFPLSDPAADLLDETGFDAMVTKLGGAAYEGTGGLLRATSPRVTTDLAPAIDGLADLGNGTKRFGKLYLKSTGTIDFSNGGYTVTHSTGNLAFSGSISVGSAIGTVGLTASLSVLSPLFEPITDGGGTLGNTSFGFSALHLSTGGVINIAAGNWVATHTSGVVTITTGDLRITTEGTNAASVMTLGGTQPVKRIFQDKGGREYNVKAYGAVGDGVANDTAAIQAALDACKAAGGGKVFVPTGTYKITATLTWDISAIANETTRLCLEGSGVSSTISLLSVGSPAFSYVGNPAWPQGHLVIRNLKFLGNVTTNSIGIKLRGGLAFNSLEHVAIYAFQFGYDAADVDQTNYYNVTIRNCGGGVIVRAAISVTSANSHHFFGCTIGNNTAFGVWITNGNSIDFFGGTIQYNSTVGAGTGNFGILITESGDGYAQINVVGVAFEGNGGLADFISDQTTNPATCNFIGCSFTRTAAFGPTVGYATTNIWAIGTNANARYNLSGNTFRSALAGYTASALRPNLTMTNPNAKWLDDGTNFYESVLEGPAWRGQARFPNAQAWDSFIYQSTITADQNDYECGQTAAIVGVSANATRAISGIVKRSAGSMMMLANLGVNDILLLDRSVSAASAAANRFAFGTSRILQSGDSVLLFYDGANAVWLAAALGGKTMFQAYAAWSAWNPVVTATTGTYTTVTSAGFYRQVGNTIEYRVKITLTTVGTGSGKMKVPVPVGTFRSDNCGVGIEIALTGKTVTAWGQTAATNFFQLQFYDNTSAFGSGTQIVISGTYEIN